jgi:hypothetical protein
MNVIYTNEQAILSAGWVSGSKQLLYGRHNESKDLINTLVPIFERLLPFFIASISLLYSATRFVLLCV